MAAALDYKFGKRKLSDNISEQENLGYLIKIYSVPAVY